MRKGEPNTGDEKKLYVNDLSLAWDGDFDITFGATGDYVKLLGSDRKLSIGRKATTLTTDRAFADIDFSGSGNNSAVLNPSITRVRLRHNAGDTVVNTGSWP